MAFNPTAVIHACNVPFDSTYRNQIFFNTVSEQSAYFMSKSVYQFGNYLTVRKVKPDGGVQSSIKVEMNIDALYDCNYLMYMNKHHGTKWFYAFITKLIYINEETTEIVFETDVYQTWLFDVTIKASFVEREHSVTDNFNEHVVPEPFGCEDYTYAYVGKVEGISDWGYLIALSNSADSSKEGEMAKEISGIYQGLFFYYFKEYQDTAVRAFLESLDKDSVQFITVVPGFCMEGVTVGPTTANPNVSAYYVQASSAPTKREWTIAFDRYTSTFEGYKPKNKKLYTAPWTNLIISDHAGKSATYNVEEFVSQHEYSEGNSALAFNVCADISSSPSLYIYPRYYKGLPHNYDCGFSLSEFPQCSYANDAFKLWMAKTTEQRGVNNAVNTFNTLAGAGLSVGGLLAANPALTMSGSGMLVNGITGYLNNWANVKAAEHQANRAMAGSPSHNLLTALGEYCISFYKRTARKDVAKCVDDFFTMYGYQTNKVKVPNLSSRPYFNYIKTNGINIVGSIPNDDMERLKRVYDEGVTLWKKTATVGDYSVDNSP